MNRIDNTSAETKIDARFAVKFNPSTMPALEIENGILKWKIK